jgi:hypothetical protein
MENEFSNILYAKPVINLGMQENEPPTSMPMAVYLLRMSELEYINRGTALVQQHADE